MNLLAVFFMFFTRLNSYNIKLSKINKSNKKQNNWKKIVEIDSNKIDADFNYIVEERNRIYLKRFLRNTAIFLVTVAVLIWALM